MKTRELHILPVQGNVYMLVGAGGNITVQVGSMGVLLVDTGLAQYSDKVIAAVRTLSNKADPLHHQYARASRSCGRERGAGENRRRLGARSHAGEHARRNGGVERPNHRASKCF